LGCQLLYKVNNDGQIDWLNLIPGTFTYGKPHCYQDNIYVFKSDFSENFSNGKHSFTTSKGTPTLAVRKMTAKTGETEYFESIHNRENDISIDSDFHFENDKFIFEIKNSKKKVRKVLVYEL
jgi:hypothetical protein